MVFIHGGAFLMGSGSTLLYDGSRLAARGDVVVVTLNYRLGALGALDLRDAFGAADGASANLGLRDQLAALAWVRANIEAFGGDPDAVTVFGESAGAMSIGALLGAPASRGLFQRAILQSGAAHNVSSAEQAARVAEHFLEAARAARREPRRGFATRRSLSCLRAQRETTLQLALPLGGLPFQPSVDGDVLPVSPLEAIERGGASGVSVLAGTNRDEWKLFLLGRRARAPHGRGRAAPALRPRAARGRRRERLRGVPRAPHAKRPSDTRERWSSFQGDRVFHWPAARLLELASRHSRETFAYSFTWAPPLLERQIGACHGIELPFVFGTILEPWLRPWLGAMPGARKLSHRMQESWLAFAKTGHPGHAGVPFWPAYDTEKRHAMKLGRSCAVIPDYADSAIRFFGSD